MIQMAQEITGRKKPEEALSQVLESYLKTRINECEQEISRFQKKYKMDFEKFKAKLGKQIPLSYEHEKDYMNWEAAMTEYKFLKSKFKKLKAYGA